MIAKMDDRAKATAYPTQLQLMLEELCSDLCRFEHAERDQFSPQTVKINREQYLGSPGAFADITVRPRNAPPYVVEVKFGYAADTLIRHLRRKYSAHADCLPDLSRIILVIDSEERVAWPAVEAEIKTFLRPGLLVEVWNERKLLALIRERFNVSIPAISSEQLLGVRHAIDRAKGFYAFGGPSLHEYEHDPLKAELLWHFGFWKLQRLREDNQLGARDILPPGLYRGVAILIADLCSFSSYVRDTPDTETIADSLTSFYSRARYQIINSGGMLYQFVGDEVIGLFGIPKRSADFANDALETARALVDIGNSVSQYWQRHIDRLQGASGLHIGLAVGDLLCVPSRPYGRTHMECIGDGINMAARLMQVAGPSDIVVSNSFHQLLDGETQAKFQELEPVDARNVGRITAWKLPPDELSSLRR